MSDPHFGLFMSKVLRSRLWTDVTGWTWPTPAGGRQSLEVLAVSDVGTCNLLWLAMNEPTAPRTYDLLTNALAIWVLAHSHAKRTIPGWPGGSIADTAETLTLEEFAQLKAPAGPATMLVSLARERLAYVKA